MTTRTTRIKQYGEPHTGVICSLSPTLLNCAFSELTQALDERRRPVVRIKNNHYSEHSIGSIVLLVTAFDAWLNEGMFSFIFSERNFSELANKPSMDKYYKIIKVAIGREIPPNNELDLVIKVRDEIVHFLPRVIERPGFKKNVPQWFDLLLKRGLLLSSPHPKIEVPLGNNLSSYRLAYWAWETIDAAVADYSRALGDESMRFTCSENFKIYRSIPSPSNLSTYDASNGLDLTR